jgi:hypothetical protein
MLVRFERCQRSAVPLMLCPDTAALPLCSHASYQSANYPCLAAVTAAWRWQRPCCTAGPPEAGLAAAQAVQALP